LYCSEKSRVNSHESKFTSEINKSHNRLRRAIEQELNRSGLIGDQGVAATNQLTALFISVLQTAGQSQMGNVQQELRKVINDITDDVNKPVQQLSKDIEDIRGQLKNLPIALPESKQ
jgi:gas vesicle protein